MKRPAASSMKAAKTKTVKTPEEVDQIIPEKTIQNDMIVILHGGPLDDTMCVPYLQHSTHYPGYLPHIS